MNVLETDRLLLRRLRSGDLDDLFALYRDPEIRRGFPDGTLTREQTLAEINWFANGHPRHPELGLWATLLKHDGRFIGRCGLLPWTLDGKPEVEVAYLLDKACWGQGLATEAATAIVQHARQRLGLGRLVCLVMPGNDASARVALRIGMRFERDFIDDQGASALYSMQLS